MPNIKYFKSSGRENFEDTLNCVKKRLKMKDDITKVFLFAATLNAAELYQQVLNDCDVKLHVVTFPANQPMYETNDTEDTLEYIPETSNTENRNKLEKLNITIVQGSLPLDDIFLPGSSDNKMMMIQWIYDTISKGLLLCINSAVLACDAGHVKPNEKIIALGADTAVVMTAANKQYMFHPSQGIHICEILCKPY